MTDQEFMDTVRDLYNEEGDNGCDKCPQSLEFRCTEHEEDLEGICELILMAKNDLESDAAIREHYRKKEEDQT